MREWRPRFWLKDGDSGEGTYVFAELLLLLLEIKGLVLGAVLLDCNENQRDVYNENNFAMDRLLQRSNTKTKSVDQSRARSCAKVAS